jgi:hypothetical protein
VQDAEEARRTEQNRGAADAWDAAEEARLDEEVKRLLAEATVPGASPATVVGNGRKVAARSGPVAPGPARPPWTPWAVPKRTCASSCFSGG